MISSAGNIRMSSWRTGNLEALQNASDLRADFTSRGG